jgi:hypothetical protein
MKLIDAELAQILVEVREPRRQRDRVNPGLVSAVDQPRDGRTTGRIGIAGDVEASQRRRKQDARQPFRPRAWPSRVSRSLRGRDAGDEVRWRGGARPWRGCS